MSNRSSKNAIVSLQVQNQSISPKTIIRQLLIFFSCLSIAVSTQGQEQRYPCIDYVRINAAYECQFDLYIGQFVFRDGIILPEKTLEPHEINKAIDEVMLDYASEFSDGNSPLSYIDPCKTIDPLNGAIREMRFAIGNDYSQSLSNIYNQAITDFANNIISTAIPSEINVIAHLASGDVSSLVSDAMGDAGNFYSIFFDLLKSHQDYSRLMDAIKQNKDVILKGRQAALMLDEFYDFVYEKMKEKMGEMRWIMRMGKLDKHIINRTVMGVQVPVEYTVELDMKKMVNRSKTFEGMYLGNITIQMKMNQGDFDSRFSKTANPVKEPVDLLYKMAPQGRNAQYQLTTGSPTSLKLVAQIKGADVAVKKAGKSEISASLDPDNAEFGFDYNMKVVAVNNFTGATSIFKDEFKLSSSDARNVKIEPIPGQQTYITPTDTHSDDSYMEGWRGDTVDLGENDLLEALKPDKYIIVKLKNRK